MKSCSGLIAIVIVCCALVSSARGQANITGSSITHNFNLAGPAVDDLDVVPAGHTLSDWAVWDTATITSNELVGGPATFGNLSLTWLFGPTQGLPANFQSWSLSYSNAQNAAPPSGSNFGYGEESATTFDTGTYAVDITPNLPIGSSGTIRVFGETDCGSFFGSMMCDNMITTDIGGAADADGDQTWSMNTAPEVRDSWMYEFTFENYNGETFNFQIETAFLVTNPRLNIAAVQISSVDPIVPTCPTAVTVTLGSVNSGTVADVCDSDDTYLILDPQFQSARYQLIFLLDATASTDCPTALEFTLESRMVTFVGTVDQRTELFNYNTGNFEVVDNRLASSTDTVVTITPGGDPKRFVEPVTGAMQARIRYQNSLPFWVTRTASLYLPFRTRVDQAIWTVTP